MQALVKLLVMDIFNFQNYSKIKTSTKFVQKLLELNKVVLQIVYPYKRILKKDYISQI